MKGGWYDCFLRTFPHCARGGTRRYVAHRGGTLLLAKGVKQKCLHFFFSLGMEQKRGNSMAEETKELLSCEPERLGHATFLDEEAKEVVLARRTCIEICLTSNLLCVICFSLSSLFISPPRV